ncbi:Alpha/beta knot methyltransferase [Thamnidium elegans]|nr:Alpha/beta knot methyltransferase [Thamnidium elegans]
MSTSPFQYHIPQLFKRLANQHNATVKHLISLREKKKYRLDHQSVIIQGAKTIKELRDKGFHFNSIAITAKKNPNVESDIKYPSIDVLKHPDSFSAEAYYVTDVDVTRRILGTSSRPSNHEVFAEVPIPDYSEEELLKEKDRLLVFDGISDPGNLGTLIRTASALGWESGLVASQSCDLYNDKTLRASRALSLSWKHKELDMVDAIKFLKSNGFTPVIADMMPANPSSEIWSPEQGTKTKMEVKPGTGIWFWNFNQQPKKMPKKLALILSSEHHGVNELNEEIRVSIPMSSNVESLNVANAGSIIMNELNRYL